MKEEFVLKKITPKKMMTQIICPKKQPKKDYDDKEFLMFKIAKRMITRNLSKTPKQ
jgi:hypothetical protein